MKYILTAPERINTTVNLPASKSVSNRALIINALAGNTIKPDNLSDCDDTEVILDALERMPAVIDIKAAGTAMRFMTAYLAATPGEHTITGTERMKQRPIKALVDALRYIGADITYVERDGYPPLHIRGRKLEGGGSNLRGMFWATRLTNDSIDPNDTSRHATPFKWEPQSPHYYVLAFSRDSVSENQLLFDIARHNFSTFEIKDFDLEQMNFGRLGLLIIKGFNNFEELVEYKSLLAGDDKLHLPPSVRHVMISVDNFNLLVNEGRSLEEYFIYLEQLNQARGDAMMDEENDTGPNDDESPDQ